MSYIYQADMLCDACGEKIRGKLYRIMPPGASSDDFPQGPYSDDEEADTPQHCAAGKHCLNAIMLPSGEKVGYLFGELTLDGVEYVKEAISEGGEVADLWQKHYRDKGYNV